MRLWDRDDSGTTSVEYGLIVFLVAATVVVVVFSLGRLTGAHYTHTCENMAHQIAPATTCTE